MTRRKILDHWTEVHRVIPSERNEMTPVWYDIDIISHVFTEGISTLYACETLVELEDFRSRWLGSKGRVKALLSLLSDVDPKYRSLIARNIEAVKTELTAAHEAKLGEVPEYCG